MRLRNQRIKINLSFYAIFSLKSQGRSQSLLPKNYIGSSPGETIIHRKAQMRNESMQSI
jgi:L-lactate utilization protein LutC